MSWRALPIPTEGRADWLFKRRDGIGASDVAGILELSPWATPFSVWASKTQELEDEATEAMRWGLRLEDLIIEAFEAQTDLHVHGRQWLVRHNRHPWAMATLDGLPFESPEIDYEDVYDTLGVFAPGEFEPLGVIEVKTDAGFGAWSDGVPDHVRIQVMWQMFVTGLTNAWLAVLHGGRRFEVYEVGYDARLAASIFERVSEWRDRYIVGDEIPEPDAGDTKIISELWPTHSDGVRIELSDDMAADLEALKGWKKQKKEAIEECKRLENRLRVAMQTAEIGTVGGEEAVTFRSYHNDGYTVEPFDYRTLRIK